ncbi:hypothetical protein SOPP22_16435 [Shewanella sp. OPT22]|nr:hypothetical protein SOPP22_16435 [Shewanella sp. OPT22]
MSILKPRTMMLLLNELKMFSRVLAFVSLITGILSTFELIKLNPVIPITGLHLVLFAVALYVLSFLFEYLRLKYK